MAKLTIKDTPSPELNGEYELDLAAGFTKAEYFIMKKHVGVVLGDMAVGLPIDANVMTAWGLVVLKRAGKEHLFPYFMETNDEQAGWDFTKEEAGEDDALPPVSALVEDEKPNVPSESSGPNTNGDSEDSLAMIPPPTGSPHSATGAI
jgi:hypothetical protein